MTPEEFIKRIKKMREFQFTQADFKKFAEIALIERKEGLDRGETPDGERFQPLAESTIMYKSGRHKTTIQYKGRLQQSRRRRASATPESPLIDTGRLRNATTEATNRKGRVVLAGSRSKPVWNGKSISQIHDEGTARIPRRHHWGIYQRAVERIRRAAESLFEDEVIKVMVR